ncbi:MAG: ISH3 family transposase [Rhodopirellula sp.]|nr:ISH3 family transposase [Rhodopirellula sp.]
MRSRTDYIVTKDEVYSCANDWLASALRLEYAGTKCNASILLQVLLIAAARVVSIFAACRDLADAPSDQTIRNALAATLPALPELERRLNLALATNLPKALKRRARMVAIDLTLIPYHGQPAFDEKEIYRSEPKSGTTHFHAYATAVVVHKGYRYTLGLIRVEYGETMKEVVQKLVRIVRRRNVKIKFLLLDKGFFSVDVISYLRRVGYSFVIPAVARGRKPKPPKPLTGLRALKKQNNGYYQHTLTSTTGGTRHSIRVTICVASKGYIDKKTGKRRCKKMLHVVWKVRLTPKDIREIYRKRFGIETSYRQMNEARIKTCTRDPAQRLLFVGIALVLRNVWVWLHFKLAKGKWSNEPQLFLQLLRFKEMLLWISQIVGRFLGADQKQGIDRETYQRLTENI